MIHHSLTPEVCGTFNVLAAEQLAEDLLLSRQRIASEVDGSQRELPANQNGEVLRELDFTITNPGLVPTSTHILVQNLAKPPVGNNNHLHIDTHNTTGDDSRLPVAPLDFTFGFSTHPLGCVVGDIDFREAIEEAGDSLPAAGVYVPEWLFEHQSTAADHCVEQALGEKTARLVYDYAPGDILYIPKGCIHIGASILGVKPPIKDIPRITIKQFLSV